MGTCHNTSGASDVKSELDVRKLVCRTEGGSEGYCIRREEIVQCEMQREDSLSETCKLNKASYSETKASYLDSEKINKCASYSEKFNHGSASVEIMEYWTQIKEIVQKLLRGNSALDESERK